jgi:hypothetical protein
VEFSIGDERRYAFTLAGGDRQRARSLVRKRV